MVAESVEKAKIRSTNGSLRNPVMNKIYQFLLKTFGDQPKTSFVAMETTTVAMGSEEPSDRSQPKFMTLFYRKTFTKLKSIK